MFGHIFRCTLKIYIVLYSYKLSLTSYVGLKIKQNLKFLQFLRFFHFQRPLPPREAVKQICDS